MRCMRPLFDKNGYVDLGACKGSNDKKIGDKEKNNGYFYGKCVSKR